MADYGTNFEAECPRKIINQILKMYFANKSLEFHQRHLLGSLIC